MLMRTIKIYFKRAPIYNALIRTYTEILHLNIRQIEAGILDHFAVLVDSRKHNERDSRKNRSNSDDAAQRLQRLVRTILSCQPVNFVAPTKINRRAHA
jgi:hypothetical protein